MENQENTKVLEHKKQAISKTYALTQFKQMIEKLKSLGWINEKEEKELKEIHSKCKNKYIESL